MVPAIRTIARAKTASLIRRTVSTVGLSRAGPRRAEGAACGRDWGR